MTAVAVATADLATTTTGCCKGSAVGLVGPSENCGYAEDSEYHGCDDADDSHSTKALVLAGVDVPSMLEAVCRANVGGDGDVGAVGQRHSHVQAMNGRRGVDLRWARIVAAVVHSVQMHVACAGVGGDCVIGDQFGLGLCRRSGKYFRSTCQSFASRRADEERV